MSHVWRFFPLVSVATFLLNASWMIYVNRRFRNEHLASGAGEFAWIRRANLRSHVSINILVLVAMAIIGTVNGAVEWAAIVTAERDEASLDESAQRLDQRQAELDRCKEVVDMCTAIQPRACDPIDDPDAWKPGVPTLDAPGLNIEVRTPNGTSIHNMALMIGVCDEPTEANCFPSDESGMAVIEDHDDVDVIRTNSACVTQGVVVVNAVYAWTVYTEEQIENDEAEDDGFLCEGSGSDMHLTADAKVMYNGELLPIKLMKFGNDCNAYVEIPKGER